MLESDYEFEASFLRLDQNELLQRIEQLTSCKIVRGSEAANECDRLLATSTADDMLKWVQTDFRRAQDCTLSDILQACTGSVISLKEVNVALTLVHRSGNASEEFIRDAVAKAIQPTCATVMRKYGQGSEQAQVAVDENGEADLCQHCGCTFLLGEPRDGTWCCRRGAMNQFRLRPLPRVVIEAFEENVESCSSWLNMYSRRLNNHFSFAELRTTGWGRHRTMDVNGTSENSAMKICGRAYVHMLPTLRKQLMVYVCDGEPLLSADSDAEELEAIRRFSRDLKAVLVRTHQLAGKLRAVSGDDDDSEFQVMLSLRDGSIDAPGPPEMSVVIVDPDQGEYEPRELLLTLDGDNPSRSRPYRLKVTDARADPIHYPVLFPHGELGWGLTTREFATQTGSLKRRHATLEDLIRFRYLSAEHGTAFDESYDSRAQSPAEDAPEEGSQHGRMQPRAENERPRKRRRRTEEVASDNDDPFGDADSQFSGSDLHDDTEELHWYVNDAEPEARLPASSDDDDVSYSDDEHVDDTLRPSSNPFPLPPPRVHTTPAAYGGVVGIRGTGEPEEVRPRERRFRLTPYTHRSADGSHYVSTNRFHMLGKLGQEHLVDLHSRVQEQRVTWEERKQLNKDRRTAGKEAEFTSHFFGSYRHVRELARNGMTLVRKIGLPLLFITLTCSTFWPEFGSVMFAGQRPLDSPTWACRIFNQRFRYLRQRLKDGSAFPNFKRGDRFILAVRGGDGQCGFILHSIEFQKRGFPHAHILLRPHLTAEYEEQMAQGDFDWVDGLISAEIPDENDIEYLKRFGFVDESCEVTREAIELPDGHRYTQAGGQALLLQDIRQAVRQHMLHQCTRRYCKELGECRFKFPFETREKTGLSEDSRFLLYRRKPTDQWVVPYNPWLLLTMNCHTNIVLCHNPNCIGYLYKYVFKPGDRTRFGFGTLDAKGEVQAIDPISEFWKASYTSATQSAWRSLRFKTFVQEPRVHSVGTHRSGESHKIRGFTALERYLARPMRTEEERATFEQLTFTDFLERYTWKTAPFSDHCRHACWFVEHPKMYISARLGANPLFYHPMSTKVRP